jgi:hypothetical protein
MTSKYMLPRSTAIRFEAVWTVRVAYVRYANKIVRGLLKRLEPKLSGEYRPSYTGNSGYDAKVKFCTMEEIDPEEGWPEW